MPDTGQFDNPLSGQIDDLQTREQICGLVRYHGRPVFLQEPDEPVDEIVGLSWLTDNALAFQVNDPQQCRQPCPNQVYSDL